MNDPKLRIVGGIDSAHAIERSERIAKIDELLAEEHIDLDAVANDPKYDADPSAQHLALEVGQADVDVYLPS